MGIETISDISLLDSPITPYQARTFLESIHVCPDEWGQIMSQRHGYHPIQALITIAQGDSPKLWAQVCRELRENQVK
jgi:hypothetical protein